MSVLLPEPGFLIQVDPTVLFNTTAVTTKIGEFSLVAASNGMLGTRNSSSAVGVYISSSDVTPTNDSLNVPGFALKKGLRVMTIVDNKVMAFRNIVD